MKNLVLVGSSIFQQWDVSNLKGLNVFNLAVGGTTTEYWLENIKNNIKPNIQNYAIYCGSNDINENIPSNKIVDNSKEIIEIIKSSNIKMQVAYFSIMKAPQKTDKFKIIDDINTRIKSSLSGNDIFVDLNSVINTNSKWYVEDDLHLTEPAYTEMGKKCAPLLQEWAI